MTMKNMKISKPYWETLQGIPLLLSWISCATTSDEAEEFEITCGLLEAASEFRTEHLVLKAFKLLNSHDNLVFV